MNKQADKYLIVIAGPTGVGKTKVSLELAKQLSTDIINADSRQIYKELNIGTAKPSQAELATVKHHFVNHISIHKSYTAADFESEALEIIRNCFHLNQLLILSGGTAFYIRALLKGFDAIPDVDPKFIKQLNQDYENKGIEILQRELQAVDPEYYNRVDIHNPRRIIRALSVWRSHQLKFSSLLAEKTINRPFIPIKIFLNRDREELYTRINSRVDMMLQNGLLEEAKTLYQYKDLQALQTVGYKELFDHIAGKTDLETSIELIKRNSRRYAKRQLTWYRNKKDWTVFHPNEFNKISTYIRDRCGILDARSK